MGQSAALDIRITIYVFAEHAPISRVTDQIAAQ